MKEKELKYGKTYRHNFPQYVIVSFMVMFALALIIIFLSTLKNNPERSWVPFTVFIPILVALYMVLFFYRKMRIETYKTKIVIYCKKFEDITFRNSYKYGYEIKYTDIESIDLMPIKTFGFLLSHQINIKLKKNETIFINGFSNLDNLCVEMRQILIYSRRHPSEFGEEEVESSEDESISDKK